MKYVIKVFVILGMIAITLLPMCFVGNVADSVLNLVPTMVVCFILGFAYSHIDQEIEKVYKTYKESLKLKEDATD